MVDSGTQVVVELASRQSLLLLGVDHFLGERKNSGSVSLLLLVAWHNDVDLVVEFDVTTPGRRIEQYFDLKSDLESLFARPVDLVELGALESPRLRRLIERSRVSLYGASA